MSAVITPTLILLATAAVHVCADPNPNSPGPGDVFVEGKPCAVSWDVDLTGGWKTMHIDLMTGNNFDMVFLANVGTVDGTNPGNNTFTYTCPQVTPHSAIYFYQFSTPSSLNKAWTTRFTITDSTNEIVAPSQSTQPDGGKIPWGKGALVDAHGSSGAPSLSGTSATSGTGSLDSQPSVVVASFAVPVTTSRTSATNRLTASVLSDTMSDTPHLFAPSSTDDAPAASSPSATSNSEANGGVAIRFVSNILVQAGVALGLTALGFAVVS